MSRPQRVKDWLLLVFSDCRFAVRQFRKSAAFTSVAVLTLALGIGANSAVFTIFSTVLIRPLPYPHAERLVKADVYDLKSGNFYGQTSYPDFMDWSEQSQFFDHLAAYEAKTFNLSGIKQPEHVKGEVASSDFFETLGIRPFQGRSFAAARNQQVVILSYVLWSRSFGSDPRTIGRSITLDGYGYEVIGVMPRDFQFPDPEAELWVLITPVRPDLREEIAARGNLGFSVIGRLNADRNLSQAQAGMTVIASGLEHKYPESN
jgi:putative ABC transport system permease protein